ncbi:hypothetical protein B9Z55_000608 [Caenorhabditis nigoni]|uniref:DDE Tnp4 domain-containing protein n=1 Tax=Caenorhabditis nigoni TaxID=1611254 RepID=A0A2G5VTZ7_9PELO|nr:hypothetical protein B9Z55_000608 [Caenorhabditis nigoni]
MAPVSKRVELARLLEQRVVVLKTIAKKLADKEKKKVTHAKCQKATYRFFSQKVQYLLRNNEIKTIVGVEQSTFEKLLKIIKKTESPVPHKLRVVIFLKFCREGSSQNALSRSVGLSQPSLSRIISACIKDLVDVAHEYIRFPNTKAEILCMQEKFANRMDVNGTTRGVPCYAVLDGKHWRTDRPPHTGSLNYNYKGFFSYNSLFLSDSDSRILYCQISKLGVNSDSQLFRNGPLEQILKRAADTYGLRALPNSNVLMPAFVLADNGFASSKTVVMPYRASQLISSDHIRFNKIISASRVKIENLFGIMTSKFQIFARNLRLDPALSRALIVACSVIHNISLPPLQVPAYDFSDDQVYPDPYRTPEQQRTALKDYLLNR